MPPFSARSPQQLLPQALSEPRIVLAVDYGTTFTGLAWMQTDGETTPRFSDLNLFVYWPGKNEAKVPSEVSYSMTTADTDDDRVFRQWGYSIDGKSKVLRWTKLELVKDRSPLEELVILRELFDGLPEVNKLHSNSDGVVDVPRHLTKTTEDIMEFYLGHVAREWHSYYAMQARHLLDTVPVDIVVTHPALWPNDARNSLLRAICGAFNKHILPTQRNVHVMSEPEACALYVIQDVIRTNISQVQAGDCFTLCDAGGGTIDLVSYYLDSISPLRLIRVGNTSGAPIGATTVDRAFLAWLDTKVKNLDIRPAEYGKGGHYVLMPRGNLLLNRFENFKRSFSGSESYDLPVPRDAIITSTPEDMESRQLHISSEKMRELFAESVTGLEKLLMRQVARVEEEMKHGRRCRVSNIFLAGGFAESEYLYKEVKKTARRFGYINVQRASDCWSSVVKGAVLRGMAIGVEIPPMIATCPRRYGLSLNTGRTPSLKEGVWAVDPLDEKIFSPTQLIWLVNRGDVIFPDSELSKTIKLLYQTQDVKHLQTTYLTLVADGNDRVPSKLGELHPKSWGLVENLTVRLDRLLPTDFKKRMIVDAAGRKKSYHELPVEVGLTVKHAVTISVRHANRVLATHTTTSL